MDVLETERKRNIEASLLNAEQVCYTRSFNVGDLCLVATHKIGKKEDDTATRLLFQNIGPFEVVTNTSRAMRLCDKNSRWLSQQSTELAMRVIPRRGYRRLLIHSVVSLNSSSIRHRSFAGHFGVSATLIAAGVRSLCRRLNVGPVRARRVLRGDPTAPSLSGTHAARGGAKQKAR